MAASDQSVEALTNDPHFTEYTTPDERIGVLAAIATLALGEVFFPGVTVWFYEQATTDLVGLFLKSLPEILFLIGMVAVHECIHYGAGWMQGHSPQFGVRWMDFFWGLKEPAPYVVTLEEYISRGENITVLIAPLVIIDAIAVVVFLLSPSPTVSHYAALVLVVNTGSSMQDFYNVVRILGMPAETEYINVEQGDLRTFYRR